MKTLQEIMTDGTFFRESNGRFYLTDGTNQDVTAKFLLFLTELEEMVREERDDAVWNYEAELDI
jgi:hypothetical protein